MRRILLPFAFLLAVTLVHADDDLEKTVAEHVARLGADDVASRDDALNALVKLGVKAEKAVRAAMKNASDPEVRGRLGAVLQSYTIMEEEAFAIERLGKAAPFPASREGNDANFILSGHTAVADALEFVRQKSGVRIETYPGDAGLAQALELAPFTGGASFSGPTAFESAVWHLMCMADVTSVVDGERVVIVRLSPAVLFTRLGNELEETINDWLEADLRAFEKAPVSYWMSGRRYLREKSNTGGEARQKWFELLRNRALDPSEPARGRSMALLGLSMFLGSVEVAQPDVDEVFARLAVDPEAPASVRTDAARGLAMGMSEAAQDRVQELLDSKDPAFQRDVLDALLDSCNYGYSARIRITMDAKRFERYRKAVTALSGSPEAGVVQRATILGAWEGDPDLQGKLVDLPEPAERRAALKFMHALHDVKTPKARERFLTFRMHKDPDLRAGFVRLVGNYAGGKDREADVDLALGLLTDPEPIVRCFAVRALETIFSSHAAERFNKGKDRVLARLEELERGEKDRRVLGAAVLTEAELGKP